MRPVLQFASVIVPFIQNVWEITLTFDDKIGEMPLFASRVHP